MTNVLGSFGSVWLTWPPLDDPAPLPPFLLPLPPLLLACVTPTPTPTATAMMTTIPTIDPMTYAKEHVCVVS